jgi:hypothetical protein
MVEAPKSGVSKELTAWVGLILFPPFFITASWTGRVAKTRFLSLDSRGKDRCFVSIIKTLGFYFLFCNREKGDRHVSAWIGMISALLSFRP